MLFAVSNLVHESVVLTTRDMRSFTIYIFNQTDNHFTNICSSRFDEEILDLAVSEVSENASRFLAVIVTRSTFYLVSGNTNGSILFERNIQHHIKNLYNVNSTYIPLHRQVVCFCDSIICIFNPYDEVISITQTVLKLDVSKRLQYRPLQQDQYCTHDIMVSLNNGSNMFILEKGKSPTNFKIFQLFIFFSSYLVNLLFFSCQGLISGCHSLQCCEVTESGDILVWWDADISSSHVSIARTVVYNAEDAVLVSTAEEMRVYTVDGLLCRIRLSLLLSLGVPGAGHTDTDHVPEGDTGRVQDVITTVQGVPALTTADPSLLQASPYIDELHFLVGTFQNELLLCSVVLPEDDSTLDDAPMMNEVTARRLYVSYDSFAFCSPSLPSQIVADETNPLETRHRSFLPYFDSVSILHLPTSSGEETREEGHLLVQNAAFGVQMARVSLLPFGKHK